MDEVLLTIIRYYMEYLGVSQERSYSAAYTVYNLIDAYPSSQ